MDPIFTTAVGQEGLNQVGQNVIADSIFDQAINEIGTNALSTAAVTPIDELLKYGSEAGKQGLMDSVSGGFSTIGDILGSKAFANLSNLGLQGGSLWMQNQERLKSNKLANEQLAMQKDVYARNKEADERRQKLRF